MSCPYTIDCYVWDVYRQLRVIKHHRIVVDDEIHYSNINRLHMMIIRYCERPKDWRANQCQITGRVL